MDTKQLGKVAATMFFSEFKDRLGNYEEKLTEMFAIDTKKEQVNFLTSLHYELLCMITIGVFNGICEPNTKDAPEKVKVLFNETFDKVSRLLELFYPTMKFMAYSMEKDGKPKDSPEGP